MWAELRCANQRADGGKVLVNWKMAMIGRKMEDGGLLVDRSACDPWKNESWRVVGQTRFFNRAGRRDDVGSRCKSRHVTDQPAKPLILALRRLLHYSPPALQRSSYAAEIADSTALFDPKQSPIPSGTLKRNANCTRRIKH